MPTMADGVSGQDKAIGGPVPGVLRAKGAEPDPEGETAEEEDALLGAEGDEEQRDGGADHRPDNAIKALRQDQPALLRLRDDEDGEQRPIRLIEVEGEGDEQRDQARAVVFAAKIHGTQFVLWNRSLQLQLGFRRDAPRRNVVSLRGSHGQNGRSRGSGSHALSSTVSAICKTLHPSAFFTNRAGNVSLCHDDLARFRIRSTLRFNAMIRPSTPSR